MSSKIYVGNLPYSVTDDSLQSNFAEFGEVTSAKVMMDRDTGRSKGFGFVEMGSDAEAQAAINGMNGQPLGGRNAVVNEARPMEARPPRSGGGGFGGGGYGGGRREGGGGGYGGGRKRSDAWLEFKCRRGQVFHFSSGPAPSLAVTRISRDRIKNLVAVDSAQQRCTKGCIRNTELQMQSSCCR